MIRYGSVAALVFSVSVVLAASAAAEAAPAGNVEEARAYHERATAAFALSHYAAAAEYFEKAFELKPDPALLYNAAQAHRLAGNKERALALYQNYLRVYGKGKIEKRGEIETHIEELKQAIERDKAVATSPPIGTEPLGGASGDTSSAARAPEPAPAPEPTTTTTTTKTKTTGAKETAAPPPGLASVSAAPAPVLLTQAPASGPETPLTRKPWFWVAAGGGVVAAVAVILLLTAGGSKDPSPSIGTAKGN